MVLAAAQAAGVAYRRAFADFLERWRTQPPARHDYTRVVTDMPLETAVALPAEAGGARHSMIRLVPAALGRSALGGLIPGAPAATAESCGCRSERAVHSALSGGDPRSPAERHRVPGGASGDPRSPPWPGPSCSRDPRAIDTWNAKLVRAAVIDASDSMQVPDAAGARH